MYFLVIKFSLHSEVITIALDIPSPVTNPAPLNGTPGPMSRFSENKIP